MLHRPSEEEADDHPCDSTEQGDYHRLVADHGLDLSSQHAESPEQADLPGPLQYRQRERVHDPDETNHDSEHEDHGYEVDDLVDLIDRLRFQRSVVLDLRLR